MHILNTKMVVVIYFRSFVNCLLLMLTLCHSANSELKSDTKANSNAFPVTWSSPTGNYTVLSGLLGVSLPESVGPTTDCPPEGADECHGYGDFANLYITRTGNGCTRVEWKSAFAKRLEDCFDIVDGHYWYGGGETGYHTWPIEREFRAEAPMVPGDRNDYGSIAENYFLISSGVSLQVDETVPLFMSWNAVHANKVCLVAKFEYPYHQQNELNLGYNICVGDNIREVHQKSFESGLIEKPTGIPDETMLIRPFWSTWAQYKVDVNQTIVLDFARRIIEEGFELNSHIEIDDDWETCYGELEFNTNKFPDPKAMVDELKALGFRVTLWVHPFINISKIIPSIQHLRLRFSNGYINDCPQFRTAVENGYLVKDQKGKSGVTGWWRGDNAGYIDFTNADAVSWWTSRLEFLRSEYGLDSFKFDAGQTIYLPASSQLTGDDRLFPSLYSGKYVEAISSFGGMIEVSSARRNQNLPIFIRMLDKDSRWGYDVGLRSLIPTLLHFGIIGYPFVLPDMIGGNAYEETGPPSAELYIRWMQANAFMPAVQFSILPWEFDLNAVKITRDILNLREQHGNIILAAAHQAVLDGSPINRPMWWLDPNDSATFIIDDQYMVGADIVVAPVVDEGVVMRDVYLPAGTWISNNGAQIEGPILLSSYPAPLEVLPYFVRMTPNK